MVILVIVSVAFAVFMTVCYFLADNLRIEAENALKDARDEVAGLRASLAEVQAQRDASQAAACEQAKALEQLAVERDEAVGDYDQLVEKHLELEDAHTLAIASRDAAVTELDKMLAAAKKLKPARRRKT